MDNQIKIYVNLQNSLNVPGLDKPHFLLYLNFMIAQDTLPAGYVLGIGYSALYGKIMKMLLLNAFNCDPAAFEAIQ